MHLPHLYSFAALIAATLTIAQTGPQAEKLPACIKACHPAATAFVDCENDDQQCACIRQEGVISNTTACAEKSCEDPEGDVKSKLCDACPKLARAGDGGNESSSGAEARAEKWTSGNGGSYGGGSGGGGGSWRSGATSSVAAEALLQWAFGGVACAITLGIMF
ncbi:hypothetical protein Q7P35_011711 [Cladosporium inversicolor]